MPSSFLLPSRPRPTNPPWEPTPDQALAEVTGPVKRVEMFITFDESPEIGSAPFSTPFATAATGEPQDQYIYFLRLEFDQNYHFCHTIQVGEDGYFSFADISGKNFAKQTDSVNMISARRDDDGYLSSICNRFLPYDGYEFRMKDERLWIFYGSLPSSYSSLFYTIDGHGRGTATYHYDCLPGTDKMVLAAIVLCYTGGQENGEIQVESVTFSDYKFDAHGNWTSRSAKSSVTATPANPHFEPFKYSWTEERKITYNK